MADDLGSAIGAQAFELEEFNARLGETAVDLSNAEGVALAAHLLARLSANSNFLADHALGVLKNSWDNSRATNPYGAQVLMLNRVAGSHFIRANFWPSADDPVLRASSAGHYAYHKPHDHNFDFITVGYLGPGYRSRWYEYDYATVTGYAGEAVELTPVEEGVLNRGRLLHYRAHRDVHDQLPPAALSISLNIIAENPTAVWRDQYHFDLDRHCVSSIATLSPNEIALRIAAALSGDGLDLAHEFARRHPSERVRWQAWRALIGNEISPSKRVALMEMAQSDASSLVSNEACALLASQLGGMDECLEAC
ncbi:MAG: transposase [Sphingopyxis sp.]